jgi:ABC-type transport system involved in multi-copper enzyme maturation permease subunit
MLKNISLAWRQKKSMAVQIVILLLLILTCGLISVILANQMPDNGCKCIYCELVHRN